MKFLLDILKAAGGEAYDLFHLVIVLVIAVWLFLQVMQSVHHAWIIDPGFATQAALILGASAAVFPIRALGQGAKDGGT